MNDNFYINRAIGWAKSMPTDKAYERISNTIASMILGVGNNQTFEDYLSENMRMKEYYDWWMDNKDKLNELVTNTLFETANNDFKATLTKLKD